MRVYLLGFMGSGKSYWRRKLAQTLGVPGLDLDEEIVRAEGRSIATIFTEDGEAAFRRLENQYLRMLSQQPNFLLACGGGTPCNGDNMAYMNQQGLTVFLDVPAAVMAQRLRRNKQKRPLLKDLSDNELQDFIEQKMKERRPYYEQAALILNPIVFTLERFTQKIQTCIEPT